MTKLKTITLLTVIALTLAACGGGSTTTTMNEMLDTVSAEWAA